jgi:hypothetical protein
MPEAERHENPHRPAVRPPVLRGHPFRPATFGAGLTLMMLGAMFMAHQLGRVALGPLATGALMTIAVAMLLVAVAIGWSHRAGRTVGSPHDETVQTAPD